MFYLRGAQMGLKLTLLGNTSIEYNGVKINFKLRKAEALVYYIALNGGASREELKAVFWYDKEDARASANLRNALYLINETMPGALNTDKRRVSVCSFTCDTDMLQSIKDPAASIPESLLWQPLKDIPCIASSTFCGWLDAERRKIISVIVSLLRERISAAYDTNNIYALEESLVALLKVEPYDEDSMLELMELYKATNRSVKAADVYKNFAAAIHTECGLQVSKRAQEYYARLFAPDTPCSNTDKFWCRTDELTQIMNTLRAKTGKNVIFVNGEAGIGKTALINKALSSIMPSSGTFIFSSRGTVIGEGYDYASWNNVIVSLGAALEKTGIVPQKRSASILSGIFPSFMREKHFSFNVDIAMMTEINPVVLALIIAEMFHALSSKARLVLVLEDVHRFDIRSVELIEAILSVVTFPIKIIISSRPESVKYMTAMFRRQDIAVTEIKLSPFTRSEILFISKSILPKSTVESRGAAYFVNESEGLPLMLFEMLRSLREDPESDCSNGLGALIMERTDRLSEKERSMLRAMSVCIAGNPDIISETAALPKNDTIQAAEVLVSKGLIEEHTQDGRPFWCFTHQKLREYIYSSIPLSRRQELHRIAASALEKRYSSRTWNPELCAAIRHHYTQSGDKALEIKQYLRELVFDVTLNHDIFPTLPDKLLLSCSAPFSSRSETERKISKVLTILDKLRYSGEGGDEYALLEATCFEIIGDYMVSWGEYDKGLIYINESAAISRKNDFHEINIYCLKHLAYMYLQTENSTMLMKTARELLTAAKEANMPQYLATAVRHIGMAYFMRLDFRLAEEIFLHSIELFKHLKLTGKNYTLSILVAKCYLGEIYQRHGMLDRAADLLKECSDVCEEMNLYWGWSYFLAGAADIALDRNDMDGFFEYIDKGVNLFESYKGGRCGYKLYSLKAIADIERFDFLGAKHAMGKTEILLTAVNRKEGNALYHLAKAWDKELGQDERRAEAKIATKLYKQIGCTLRADWIKKKFLA